MKIVPSDVKALGASAPLRAAYEASKRFGGHRVVFGTIARRTRTRVFSPPLSIPPTGSVPKEAVGRAITAGEEAAAGTVVLFGRRVEIGPTPDWHKVIEGPGTWPADPWWEIDIRSQARRGDVKWAWELGRARHVAVLARAAAVSDRDDLRQALVRTVESWLGQNPPEQGVHWYSNLEIALRTVVWAEVLARAGHLLPANLVPALGSHLDGCARHLVADLPYTLSTMRNNHLLGDALGLQVLDCGLRGPGRRSLAAFLARRIFQAQAAKHFRADGSMIEDSLSYHRFVLEMLVVERLLDPHGPARPALAASAQYLARLGVLEGPVPQYGDWDEGRVLVSSQDPQDLGGSVRCALALAGSGAPPAWREEHDECAWYTREGIPLQPEPAERNGHDIGGGIARGVRGNVVVWLKAGSGPSHGHGDLLSTPVLWDGEWAVGDPGTGTYNGPLEQRNFFRTSVAHNVVRVEGQDQLGPHRAFRWQRTAHGVIGNPLELDGWLVLWGAHDAYRFLHPARRVLRAVALRPGAVVVADWVEGSSTDARLSLPLGPGCAWDPVSSEVVMPAGRRLTMAAPTPPTFRSGQQAPFDGWWSPTYGAMQPSTRLELDHDGTGPLWWALADGTGPEVSVEGDRLVLDGGTTLRCSWAAGAARFRADGERTTEAGIVL